MTIQEAIKEAEARLPGIPARENEIDDRWQAIMQIENFIESDPQAVWKFITRWAIHPSEDLRTAVATCLLEHLLDYDFPTYFSLAEAFAYEEPLFADTLSRCWKFGKTEKPNNAKRFDRLQRYCKRYHVKGPIP